MGQSREMVLQALRRLADGGQHRVSSTELIRATGGSSATVRRHLDALCASGELVRDGKARATRYRLARREVDSVPSVPPVLAVREPGEARGGPAWSLAALQLRRRLEVPLAARDPVSYQRDFVDRYVPNASWLMPPALADELYRAGRMRDQQPAGTYARKVLEQLLIDLSWSSSRLEGNRYSLLDTQELFKRGTAGNDTDAVMLLNHKAAIEFLVDAAPLQGLSTALVRNLHAVLMQDLLPDSEALGAIRQKVVNISGSVYVPNQVPATLEEMLDSVVEKARLIKNPIEAAFFLWVNLAYLQPFEDGNKRTSRLSANIPLMLYNCSPLSFLDVDVNDHAFAMLGVYEQRDLALAVDLFTWAYRRSLRQYAAVRDSLGSPDPLRLRYREALTDAIGLVVRERRSLQAALDELGLGEASAPGFRELLMDELKKLEVFNCARYRLTLSATQAWIAASRPL
ncbi:MAG: Fic family protein [Hydrogenophaga sp.]|uniref:Fic family protein n=1 Tax=Hydrogenophaga sp. TaxID=1904254 RepID=UPI0016B3F3D9|nr:Fic family protein [Hydrogenophaga sp.]NIM41827.1 Fic family protein [Hydrogenophaga sp.]NIN27132.1 Fic family protein [Hydrogenophaga sp.]NIN31833.1 Fic family protein [Hydrogenophaga sp.]NIN56077.1 Fic family protein [Hydrogenophaga sp.]NIO52204.1 Fic family protein [Hydrogenophaga sp.]